MRTDIILYGENFHAKELSAFKINADGAGALLLTLKKMLRSYWDYFAAAGILRVILGYKFAIDNGGATPVCCKKPHYRPHESKIIMKHIKVIKGNDWVE